MQIFGLIEMLQSTINKFFKLFCIKLILKVNVVIKICGWQSTMETKDKDQMRWEVEIVYNLEKTKQAKVKRDHKLITHRWCVI